MNTPDTDLLFPPRVIPTLASLRSQAWQELIERVQNQSPGSPDRLAFVLFMVRLSGCTSCHADSFRALRGCSQCALQTIRRFRGSDEELFGLFAEARAEVISYLDQ